MGQGVLLVFLTIAGCARTPHPSSPAPVTAARPSASPTSLPASAPSDPRTTNSSALDGAIRRSELLFIHRLGPQEFIQQLQVRPAFRRGRFFGWRIVAYSGPGPVRGGDVVTQINGKPIERPDQFMTVWEKLPAAQELVVQMWRGGREVTLRYPIISD